MSFAPSDNALTIAASERSKPLVIAPPPEEVTLIPAGSVFDAFLLSTKIN